MHENPYSTYVIQEMQHLRNEDKLCVDLPQLAYLSEEEVLSKKFALSSQLQLYFRRVGVFQLNAKSIPGDRLSFGYQQSNDQKPELLIESHDLNRILQLKMLGIATGETPAARAISMLGSYIASNLDEASEQQTIGDKWKKKWQVVVDAQIKLLQLEKEELALFEKNSDGSFKYNENERFFQFEKIRLQMIHTIDDAIAANDALSIGTTTDGRLGKLLHSTRAFVKYYKFYPNTLFTSADQLKFSLEDKPPYVYHAKLHGGTTPSALKNISNTLRYMYPQAEQPIVTKVSYIKGSSLRIGTLLFRWSRKKYHQNKAQETITQQVILTSSIAMMALGRLMGCKLPKTPPPPKNNLEVALQALRESDPGLVKTFTNNIRYKLPEVIRQQVNLGNYFTRQIDDIKLTYRLSYETGNKYLKDQPIQNTQTKQSIIEATSRPPTITQHPAGTVQVPENYYRSKTHHSGLANLARLLRDSERGFEKQSDNSPITTTIILAMAGMTAGAAIAPSAIMSFLIKLGFSESAAAGLVSFLTNVVAAIPDAATPAEQAFYVFKALRGQHGKIRQFLQNERGIENYIRDIQDKDRFSLTDMNNCEKLSEENQLALADTYLLDAQQEIDAIRKKEHPGLIGSLVIQPFRFLFPITRILVATLIVPATLFGAIPFALANKQPNRGVLQHAASLIKSSFKLFENETKNGLIEVNKGLSAMLDGVLDGAHSIVNLSFTFARLTMNLPVTLTARLFGIPGHICITLGKAIDHNALASTLLPGVGDVLKTVGIAIQYPGKIIIQAKIPIFKGTDTISHYLSFAFKLPKFKSLQLLRFANSRLSGFKKQLTNSSRVKIVKKHIEGPEFKHQEELSGSEIELTQQLSKQQNTEKECDLDLTSKNEKKIENNQLEHIQELKEKIAAMRGNKSEGENILRQPTARNMSESSKENKTPNLKKRIVKNNVSQLRTRKDNESNDQSHDLDQD